MAMLLIGSSFSAQDLFTCYDQWRKVFENRGADPVNDGIHDNIVVTIRTGDVAECVTARAIVKGGVVIEIAYYFDDNTFEKVEYEWESPGEWSIHNGMSRTKTTVDDEMINVMFINKIKPKKKKVKKAPVPNYDLN